MSPNSDAESPQRIGWFVLLQASLQAVLRPAIWCPLLNRVHSYREKWAVPSGRTAPELVDSVVKAVDLLSRQKSLGCDWLVRSANRETGRITVLNLTPSCKWLDVMEIDLGRGSATSFSTGLLPVLVPLAPLLNLPFFSFPFSDLGTNAKRLAALRQAMEAKVNWQAGSADVFQLLFY